MLTVNYFFVYIILLMFINLCLTDYSIVSQLNRNNLPTTYTQTNRGNNFMELPQIGDSNVVRTKDNNGYSSSASNIIDDLKKEVVHLKQDIKVLSGLQSDFVNKVNSKLNQTLSNELKEVNESSTYNNRIYNPYEYYQNEFSTIDNNQIYNESQPQPVVYQNPASVVNQENYNPMTGLFHSLRSVVPVSTVPRAYNTVYTQNVPVIAQQPMEVRSLWSHPLHNLFAPRTLIVPSASESERSNKKVDKARATLRKLKSKIIRSKSNNIERSNFERGLSSLKGGVSKVLLVGMIIVVLKIVPLLMLGAKFIFGLVPILGQTLCRKQNTQRDVLDLRLDGDDLDYLEDEIDDLDDEEERAEDITSPNQNVAYTY